MPTTRNIYFDGNFAPVHEEITSFDLPVHGVIPIELEGRLLRNGPNPVTPVDPATNHWFSGHGMVHGVRIRGGRAEWYRNRWVRSDQVSDALGEPRISGSRRRAEFSPNTNVGAFAGRTYAMVEAGTQMGLEPGQARQLALATFAGASALAGESSEPLSLLRERVTSKGGTTHAALTAMHSAGVKEHFIAAMRAAQMRARELGQEFGRL